MLALRRTAAKTRKERMTLMIGFLGGDRRMEIAAAFLKEQSHSTVMLDAQRMDERLPSCELLVLPYPATRDGVTVAGTALPFSALPLSGETALFGGRLPPAWRCGRPSADAEENEEYLRQNAYLTAAAGVGTALRAGERAFFRVRAAVLGFGRIGKETARMLRALGADVTVYARRVSACEAAEREGLHAHPLSGIEKIDCDLLFGTVPAPAHNLAPLRLSPHALVYDLGGGLPDAFETEEGESVRTLPLRGAPGVFAPRAAGEIYGGAILDFIHTLERRTTV